MKVKSQRHNRKKISSGILWRDWAGTFSRSKTLWRPTTTSLYVSKHQMPQSETAFKMCLMMIKSMIITRRLPSGCSQLPSLGLNPWQVRSPSPAKSPIWPQQLTSSSNFRICNTLSHSNFHRYVDQATKDLHHFTSILHEVLAERGVFKESITPDDIKLFC